jgi:hypothetical protein
VVDEEDGAALGFGLGAGDAKDEVEQLGKVERGIEQLGSVEQQRELGDRLLAFG